MGFEFEEGQPYLMPAHFGPVAAGWNGEVAHYADNTALTILYATEHDAASALLPPGFTTTETPIVSVSHVMCRGVDFMAGRGYNLVAVNVSATFEGKRDKASGSFALVLWENDFMPIVVGREVLGAAKLMADIPDAWLRGEERGFSVSENGTPLFEGKASGLEKLSDEAVQMMSEQMAAGIWMGWKYLPTCDLKGAEVSHATALPANTDIKEAWMGAGEIAFHEVEWEKAPMSSHVVNALRALPVVQYQGAVMTRGSQDLLIRKQYAME